MKKLKRMVKEIFFGKRNYVKNECPKENDATVEDSYTVNISTSKGEEKKFRILDTAGEEDYQTMVDEQIKSANGFLLLFAINE